MSIAEEIVHISSLVVLCKPAFLNTVVRHIESQSGAEIHAVDDSGKIIVVLETPNEQHVLDGIGAIETLEGVISATLVYHQID